MNNRGQSALAEHVMVFFIVVAALVAMTVYVQRSLEARIHDARNNAIDELVNSGVCDANCLAATGGSINHEYEPYYTVMSTSFATNGWEQAAQTNGSANSIGAIYYNNVNEDTIINATSGQLPAACAQGGCQ
jgi:hypothetical protein